MNWIERIPGCFGDVDMFFAVHPLDRQRAAELLAALVKEQVAYDSFASEIVRYLQSNSCGDAHIDEQMTVVSMLFTPWID